MKQQYFQLSRTYHPDFFGNASDDEKNEALEKSSQVNKAFKIFNSEGETIKYVLQLKGLLQEEEKYELPKNFLMEMMELNEELMDAKMEGDVHKIEKVTSGIGDWESGIKKEVETILSTATVENLAQIDLLKVKEYYFKKKYLNRILDSLK